MTAAVLLIVALAALLVAYIFYGAFLSKRLGIDPDRATPAHTMTDGVDYVPAKAPVLLGHHFASIAGASPIIGPVTAAVFGWVPVFLWAVLGSIFVGGAHDMSSLVASLRHKGKSIGEIIEDHIGVSGKTLFLIFSLSTLVLIVAVFTNVVASTFVSTPAAATASLLFLLLAGLFGQALYRFRLPLGPSTLIGVLLLFSCIWVGVQWPLQLSRGFWIGFLIVYIYVAAVTPVWALLQPRDYLNSFLLYVVLGAAVLGVVVARPEIQLPAFTGFTSNLGFIFPVLFVTVACGAVSGFHSLVASGTTAKQLNNERDAKLVAYGGDCAHYGSRDPFCRLRGAELSQRRDFGLQLRRRKLHIGVRDQPAIRHHIRSSGRIRVCPYQSRHLHPPGSIRVCRVLRVGQARRHASGPVDSEPLDRDRRRGCGGCRPDPFGSVGSHLAHFRERQSAVGRTRASGSQHLAGAQRQACAVHPDSDVLHVRGNPDSADHFHLPEHHAGELPAGVPEPVAVCTGRGSGRTGLAFLKPGIGLDAGCLRSGGGSAGRARPTC